MDYFEKLSIIFGFLIIIVYFLFYFDLQKVLITCLLLKRPSSTENFSSYLFKPQKLFQNNGKIYLLDTQRVLEIDSNPLIFNSYLDYQKYIISLEKDFRENIRIKIGKNRKKIEEITEDEIPSLDFKFKNKKDTENMNPYYQNYECQRQSAHCDLDENRDPFFSSIYDPVKLKEFKKKNCQKKLLSKDQCEIIKMMAQNEKNLNGICYDSKMNLPEYQEKYKDICQKHKLIQNHRDLLEKTCSADSNYLDNCKLDDFFREELLSSLSK